MPDFEKSFQRGVDAAKAAAKAHMEIHGVLHDLNQQLALASNGKAKIDIRELKEVVENEDLLGLTRSVFLAFGPKEYRRYKAMVMLHLTHPEFKLREIARWKQDEYGYPCWITFNGREVACGDKASLEQELAELAGSPHVGEALLAVINYIPKESASGPKASPSPGAA
jgi:hypothetical protein